MRKTFKLTVFGVLALGTLLWLGVPRARADVAFSIGIPLPGIAVYTPPPPPTYYPPLPYYGPTYYYAPRPYYAPAYGSVYFGGGHGRNHHGCGGHGHPGRRGHRW